VEGKYLVEKWRFELDDYVSFSSPVIDKDGTIYICNQGPYGYVTLYAINPDGTEKWRFLSEKMEYGNKVWHIAPALASDGTIYFGDYHSYLYAVDTNNGTLKWKTLLTPPIMSSPVIANDGTIYVGADNEMCALYPNGTIKWQYTTGETIRASSVIGEDGTVYVSSHDGYFYAFYPNNGTLKWKLKIAKYICCFSSPAIDDNGIILVGTRFDFYAINPNGSIKWINDWPAGYSGGPTIGYDGTIYAGSGDSLQALAPSGEELWYLNLGSGDSSPAITKNGMILMGGGDDVGSLNLISPTGELISYYVFEGGGGLTSSATSSPAIGEDGTVYIGSWFRDGLEYYGYLHAFEVKEHAPDLNIDVNFKFAHLEIEFSNVGDVAVRNVSWSINVMFGQPWRIDSYSKKIHDSGTFQQLEVGNKIIKNVWPIFGLGFLWMKIELRAPDANPDVFPSHEWGMLWYIVGPFVFPQP
jgi:outer membrane protein assembly factor BamB